MDFTREIYWNIGPEVSSLSLMSLLLLLAVAAAVLGVTRLVKTYRKGRPVARRFQGKAILRNLAEVLSQKRVAKGSFSGRVHRLLFWSILMFFGGSLLIAVQTHLSGPIFGIEFLKGRFYLLFSFILDLGGFIGTGAVSYFLIRRVRAEKDKERTGKIAVLSLLLAVLVSGFAVEGTRMAVTEMDSLQSLWSPVGYTLALIFEGIGQGHLLALHKKLWWVHAILAFGFMGLVPYTAMKHMLTACATSLLAGQGPKAALVPLNLEDETIENFGAAHVHDFSWKELLELDSCTRCGRCDEVCPALNAGLPLSPMELVGKLNEISFNSPQEGIIGSVGKEAIWSCTTCLACEEVCPVSMGHVDRIVEMRRNLALMEGEFPGQEVQQAMERIEVTGNPFGSEPSIRDSLFEELNVIDLSARPTADIVYFSGCYASYNQRSKNVAHSFIKLCQSAKVNVAILGKQEQCCGEPARKLGNEYLFQELAMKNIRRIRKYGIKTVVTTCPHCFNTLNKDYRDFGFTAEVLSHTEYLERLLAEGKLKVRGEKFSCTYHDPCYLGRHNDIYGPTRNLIMAAGGRLSEMDTNRQKAVCCGAGGGRFLAQSQGGKKMNIKRAEMAASTNTDQLVTSCPFCLTTLEEGMKQSGNGAMKVRDIAEVLAENI
ncbi:(Fe-S)-binding protein [Desulfovibrio sp. JC010]|uniref:(Fe-S)-binding protein n=1 Tax=Desulfovibrio sp. JC010 TaxID=2593641 RepID=UPI0013D3CCAA|nr:(Fe-S)-binding protein [Desulfovibrio sp. JC010]NDV26012.1 (Fe-S)-binding protein [Desulfovibrio sp. JC010]